MYLLGHGVHLELLHRLVESADLVLEVGDALHGGHLLLGLLHQHRDVEFVVDVGRDLHRQLLGLVVL